MAENTIETFFETYDPTDSLAHHGVKGQKWGIRRWQNLDGTLTDEGKKRYAKAKERWSDENIVKRENRTIASVLGGGALYTGGLIGGVIAANPILAGAGAVAGIAAMLAYPLKDAITTSRDNRMATLAKDEALKKKMEDIRSDQTGTRAWEVRRKVRWEKQLEKQRRLNNYEKEVAHDDVDIDDFFAHSGIKGQKWGLRRFQYADGSLTPEGRRRYLKGGDRAVRKAEKILSKREKILSDRKKLYKHRNEFSKEELDKAMERFASQDRLREQMQTIKDAKRQDKADYKRSKIEYKKLKLQEKQMKEQEKQAKLATEQKKIDTEQKNEVAEAQSKAAKWRERANKARSIYDFAKAGQDILSDMGITSKEGNESLLGALGEAMGIKDNSAAKAAAARKKAVAKETEDLNLESLRIKIANERRAFDNNYSEDKKRQAKEAVQDEIDRLNLEALRRKDATERMNFDSNYEKEKKRQSTQDIIDDLNLRQLIAKTEKAEYDAANPNKKGMSKDDIEDVVEDVLEKLGLK